MSRVQFHRPTPKAANLNPINTITFATKAIGFRALGWGDMKGSIQDRLNAQSRHHLNTCPKRHISPKHFRGLAVPVLL